MCISEKDATQIIKNINVYLDDYFFLWKSTCFRDINNLTTFIVVDKFVRKKHTSGCLVHPL